MFTEMEKNVRKHKMLNAGNLSISETTMEMKEKYDQNTQRCKETQSNFLKTMHTPRVASTLVKKNCPFNLFWVDFLEVVEKMCGKRCKEKSILIPKPE